MVSLWYYKGLYIGFTWDEEKSYSGGTTNIVPTSCLERGHLLLCLLPTRTVLQSRSEIVVVFLKRFTHSKNERKNLEICIRFCIFALRTKTWYYEQEI